jgi:hypothetical protein
MLQRRPKIRILLFLFFLLPLILKSQGMANREIGLTNGVIILPGTLSYPIVENRIPLAIFVHGSGNIDRNGNQDGTGVRANYIQALADSLNTRGIAFYRYDKRTATPANMEHSKEVTIQDFANDVKVAITHFKGNPQFGPLYLIGHSQGSLVAMFAITKEIKGYISIAGASDTIDKVLIGQVSNQNPSLGKMVGQHLAELMENDTILNPNPFLMQLFAPQNQKFLKNWVALDPRLEIKKITIPILLLNGDQDLQVSIMEAENLKRAQPSAELHIVPNMNHLLKEVHNLEENQKSYYQESFPLSNELVTLVEAFIKK